MRPLQLSSYAGACGALGWININLQFGAVTTGLFISFYTLNLILRDVATSTDMRNIAFVC